MFITKKSSQEDQYVQVDKSNEFFLFALGGRSRALVLLLALIGQILLTSLAINDLFLTSLYQAAVVLAAIFVAADSRRHLTIGLALGIPGIIMSLIGDFYPSEGLTWATLLVITLLFLFIIRLMLEKIFKAPEVTLDTIGYALCTYILLGSVWTMLYVPVAAADPQAFSQPIIQAGSHPGATLVYFSFVTLTTLGYGDISPVSPLARSLAILEALTGTLFLAVLISRLVGAYGSRRR